MQIALADFPAHLSELVARADAGEEVVLTRDNAPSLRLVVDLREPTREEKLAALTGRANGGDTVSEADRETVRERRRRALEEFKGAWKDLPQFAGATSASLQDELYDEHGLPK